MKKQFFVIFLAIAFLFGCASTSAPKLESVSESIGQDWKLIEVRINNRKSDFERQSLARGGFGEMFTLKIDSESISGVGAPNRFSAPYQQQSKEDVTLVLIGLVRSTLMMPIHEPEKLKEHEYFVYLQNTFRWGLSGENLELHSKDDNGTPVVLVFSR